MLFFRQGKKQIIFVLVFLFYSPGFFSFVYGDEQKEEPESSQQSASSEEQGQSKVEEKRVAYTGIPVLAFDSDRGIQYGAFVLATVYDEKNSPFHSQYYLGLYRSNLGMEMYHFALDRVNIDGNDLRLRADIAYFRMLNEQFFGYGNEQDIHRQRQIQEGAIPAGTNIQDNTAVFLFEEFSITEAYFETGKNSSDSSGSSESSIGPGRRELRESQDKYYTYDLIAPYSKISLQNSFASGSPWKWQAGLLAKAYRVQSYQGDYENSNTVPNTATYIDQTRPTGYDATEKWQPVTGVSASLIYDTRPPIREKNPDTGIFTDIHVEAFDRATGSAYSFHRITFTFRQYIPLFESFFKKREDELVLAYRFLTQKNTGEPPFFEAGEITTSAEVLTGLGGTKGLRGYTSYQFVGRVMALASLELRYIVLRTPLLGGMDFMIAGFQDSGRVSESLDKISSGGLHHSYGGSLRLIWQKDTVMNLTYGRSRYDSHISMAFNHAF